MYSISFWLLFSYMIPISLFVTMEIVKAFQVHNSNLGGAQEALAAHDMTCHTWDEAVYVRIVFVRYNDREIGLTRRVRLFKVSRDAPMHEDDSGHAR